MKSILVVCEGNICRSPMAQGLLATALPGVRVRSAGLSAMVGAPADETAVQLMHDRGIDISPHRARQVDRELCLAADVVLVMERGQRERLEDEYPEARGRIFLLAEHRDGDVPDPYRQPVRAFRGSLAIIDESVQHWLRRIQRL